MRAFYPLLLLCFLVAFTSVGCDSAAEGEAGGVLGRWEALDNPSELDVYLNVSDDEIIIHFLDYFSGDVNCFVRRAFDVVDRDGDAWTLRDEGGETEAVILRREGDDLVTEDPSIEDGDIVRFERSSRTDFTPLCDD